MIDKQEWTDEENIELMKFLEEHPVPKEWFESQELLQEISQQVFNLFQQQGISWSDTFIISRSISSTILQMQLDRLRTLQFNSKERDSLINLYEGTIELDKQTSPSMTALNYSNDLMFGNKAKGFSQNDFSKISISLKRRFQVLEKYGFRCVYCGRKSPEVSLQLEHIHPRSKGGTDDESNLAPACWECNLGKSNKILGEKA